MQGRFRLGCRFGRIAQFFVNNSMWNGRLAVPWPFLPGVCVNIGAQNEMKGFPYLHFCMPAQVQQCVSPPKHLESKLELGLFRKDTRFPRACTSIKDYLSPWHFIRKWPSKRREVNIWQTILHSMDSLVHWDQRVWDSDMAKAWVVSDTNCDRNVEKHPTEFRRC